MSACDLLLKRYLSTKQQRLFNCRCAFKHLSSVGKRMRTSSERLGTLESEENKSELQDKQDTTCL